MPKLKLDSTWTEIGKRCSADRRSMWIRINLNNADDNIYNIHTIKNIELCAGREGDDSYVMISKDKLNNDVLFNELIDLFCTAQFAATS